MRIWGMGVFNWGYWFPGDCSRPERDQFIAIYIGSCIIPSLTTKNANIVYQILSSELEKHRNNSQTESQTFHGQNPNSLERNILAE